MEGFMPVPVHALAGPSIAKRFPLRPAYTTTFNGCQGLTLQKAVLDFRSDLFAHRQLYTTLSRVQCRRDVRKPPRRKEKKSTTANVMYKHLSW
ncbi:hypothetical protein BDR05DRAFT_964722 [Suillus weaverae]|nr:hypothetical protein BDR05DRAFT_964722 [Suillus weaverae]